MDLRWGDPHDLTVYGDRNALGPNCENCAADDAARGLNPGMSAEHHGRIRRAMHDFFYSYAAHH